MILYLEYRGSGRRGGELYHDHLLGFLASRYDAIEPTEPQVFPPELRNPLKHMVFARNRVRGASPNVVVCDISSAARNIAAVRLAKRRGATILLVIQGHREQDLAKSSLIYHAIQWAERATFRRADIILAASRYAASLSDGVRQPECKVVIARPGLELEPAETVRPFDAGRPLRLLFVGECSRVKGLVYLVRALSLLERSKVTLDVVGGASQEQAYFESVLALVEQKHLRNMVTFHGFADREKLMSLYRSADVLIVPSLSEGCPLVVPEAFCYGLPVIASHAGGLSEMIGHDKNGLLVPPADPAALADAIQKLSDDRSLCRRYSATNREQASSLPTWADFTATLTRELVPLLAPIP
ncbi:MAG: glycosyltransferase family 4 protein [candidate division Zixibacteria bacterium]|nr:glycosyltransferase family 4 protein [candidate division Zixibacteria bacterium]